MHTLAGEGLSPGLAPLHTQGGSPLKPCSPSRLRLPGQLGSEANTPVKQAGSGRMEAGNRTLDVVLAGLSLGSRAPQGGVVLLEVRKGATCGQRRSPHSAKAHQPPHRPCCHAGQQQPQTQPPGCCADGPLA